MKVTKIRCGVYRLEVKLDEEIEIHGIAALSESTVEDTIPKLIDIGINTNPISEDEGQ